MELAKNLKALTAGLISVVILSGAYKKDDEFMNGYIEEDSLEEQLETYLNFVIYCFSVKRTKLFYRTEEECNDIMSEAFIDAFFRSKSYPIYSYNGYRVTSGETRTVTLKTFLKKSLLSKVITINTKLHEQKSCEVHEHRLTASDGQAYGFEDFLSSTGIESLEVSLEEPVDLDECDSLIKELSDRIYPQVSYVMLLKDYETSQDEFQHALKASMNYEDTPSFMSERYELLISTISKVVLNNRDSLGSMFGRTRLDNLSLIGA
jgi:hypothetical protein